MMMDALRARPMSARDQAGPLKIVYFGGLDHIKGPPAFPTSVQNANHLRRFGRYPGKSQNIDSLGLV
jgi:hypothetical protein